jgi:L-threonine kinase
MAATWLQSLDIRRQCRRPMLRASQPRSTRLHTQSLSVHRWQAPATCGELFQGALDGQDFMVNCPIDLYATAQATATPHDGLDLRDAKAYGKVMATLHQLAARWSGQQDREPGGVALQLDSPIPRSKGMASSTADASSALAAVAACQGLTLNEAEVARLLTAVEPSDCTNFRGIAHLNFLSGALLDRLPVPRGLRVLVVDCGGEVDTVHFDRDRARSVYAEHSDRLRAALKVLKRGLCSGCNRSVGLAATQSTKLSQLILPKPCFPELRALASEWGLVGINCAHSGTVLGLLYDDDAPGYEQQLRAHLAREFGQALQVIGDFAVVGGGNRAV